MDAVMQLNSVGTRRIETRRLVLRRVMLEDAPQIFENWAKDPEVARCVTFTPHDSLTTTQNVVADWIGEYADPYCMLWVIEERASGRVVGRIRAINQDRENMACELAYCLGQRWWRQGYMTEACRAAIDDLFFYGGYNRIEARFDPNNSASGAVMAKVGMNDEGIRRQVRYKNGVFQDRHYFAIVKRDWFPLDCGEPFNDVDLIEGKEIDLHCTCISKQDRDKGYVPSYEFDITQHDRCAIIGRISLRAGFNRNIYYGGNIGYGIVEAYRGHGYAAKACRMLQPLAKRHDMNRLIITCRPDNLPSRRTCERVGAQHVCYAPLPEDNELYQQGERVECIYGWQLK